MAQLLVSKKDLEKSIADVSQYFELKVEHNPKLRIRYGIGVSGSCDYYIWLPFFKGFITLNGGICDKKEAIDILDHESIHWLENDNNLKSYKIFPHHFLSLIYNPDDKIGEAWSDYFYAGLRDRLFNVKSRFESLNLVNLLNRYKMCDDNPTEENIKAMEGLLRNAKKVSKKSETEDFETTSPLYFTLVGHYQILLSR